MTGTTGEEFKYIEGKVRNVTAINNEGMEDEMKSRRGMFWMEYFFFQVAVWGRVENNS